jgi:hypothetical protein
MPIALLLEETILAFAFGGNKLSPWVHLVAMEEKLIDRARSAFLVKWFGRALPLRGFYLKVAIENLEALRDRYLAAAESVEPEVSGLNLTEPLAGALGQIAGMAFSLLSVLSAIPLAIGVGVGLPVGFLGGLFLGATGNEESGALIKLLGVAAQLLDSTSLFLEQLLGPREKVANPMLKQMLELLDHFAGLAVQLVGFIAVVVVEIGPLLLPLAVQVRPFAALIGSVLNTLGFLWDNMLEEFKKFLDPKFTLLQTIDIVVDVMSALFSKLIDTFIKFFGDELAAIKAIYHGLVGTATKIVVPFLPEPATGFHALFETVAGWLDDAVNKAPLIVNMKTAKEVFAVAGAALKSKKPSSSPSTFPDFPELKLTPAEDVKAALGGEPPLGIDDIEPIAEAMKGWAPGGIPPLSEEAARQLERARHPVSVFALEKRDLEQSLGGRKPEDVLKEQWKSQQTLRNLMAGVVGRVLPPESRESLAPYYAMIDAAIYGQMSGKKKKPDLPVRDIRDNGQLRPVLRCLTLRWPGGNKLDLVDFADQVQKALNQPYPATS